MKRALIVFLLAVFPLTGWTTPQDFPFTKHNIGRLKACTSNLYYLEVGLKEFLASSTHAPLSENPEEALVQVLSSEFSSPKQDYMRIKEALPADPRDAIQVLKKNGMMRCPENSQDGGIDYTFQKQPDGTLLPVCRLNGSLEQTQQLIDALSKLREEWRLFKNIILPLVLIYASFMLFKSVGVKMSQGRPDIEKNTIRFLFGSLAATGAAFTRVFAYFIEPFLHDSHPLDHCPWIWFFVCLAFVAIQGKSLVQLPVSSMTFYLWGFPLTILVSWLSIRFSLIPLFHQDVLGLFFLLYLLRIIKDLWNLRKPSSTEPRIP